MIKKDSNYKDWKKGDRIITKDQREGILLSDPKYISGNSYGLFYADVKWSNGEIVKSFMLCLKGLYRIREVKQGDQI